MRTTERLRRDQWSSSQATTFNKTIQIHTHTDTHKHTHISTLNSMHTQTYYTHSYTPIIVDLAVLSNKIHTDSQNSKSYNELL